MEWQEMQQQQKSSMPETKSIYPGIKPVGQF